MSANASIVQLALLGLWTAIAIGLRFYQLELKPLWTDEISTLVFSLGHSFTAVPLNQVLTADALLQPLRVDATTSARDAIASLLTYSNHPPLFFALMHGWLQHTHAAGAYAMPVVARSLSALAGGLLTPVVYLLVRLALRAPAAPQLAAVLTALSPFGIYLSQEARHYSLALVWITASLCCLVVALGSLKQSKPPSVWLALLWIGVNALGLATHYFVGITLLAELLVLVGVTGDRWRRGRSTVPARALRRIGLVALGTAASGLVWLFALAAASGQGELTQWIQSSWRPIDWINPITHTLASAVSMAYLLPIQGVPDAVALLSTGLLLAIALWSIWGVKPWHEAYWDSPSHDNKSSYRPPVPAALWGTCVAAIALLWAISYGAQIGLAHTLRYHFVYLPAGVGVVAAGLAHRWNSGHRYSRPLVLAALLISFIGGISVTRDLAYQKVHRPDRVVADMAAQTDPQRPLLIAISHQSHGQTGRLMAIAWEMQTHYPAIVNRARFFLDPQPCAQKGEQNCGAPGDPLRQVLPDASRQIDGPGGLDLWLINYVGRPSLPRQGCRYRETGRVDGYKYQHYRCR